MEKMVIAVLKSHTNQSAEEKKSESDEKKIVEGRDYIMHCRMPNAQRSED